MKLHNPNPVINSLGTLIYIKFFQVKIEKIKISLFTVKVFIHICDKLSSSMELILLHGPMLIHVVIREGQ